LHAGLQPIAVPAVTTVDSRMKWRWRGRKRTGLAVNIGAIKAGKYNHAEKMS
jgi:hypothetical protein